MEFSEDFIQENGLSEEQVSKIAEQVDNHVSELQKGWDGKANENAERILEGASRLAIEKMGINGVERNQGEKYADFLQRATPMFVESALAKEREALTQKQRELDAKISNGDDATKAEVESLKQKLDALKEKEAKFAEWEENDYKGKYEETTKKLSALEQDMAFNSVKPSFAETVNKYEADYKWAQFKNSILEKNHIKIVDGEAILVDKENEYKTQKLSDALKKDEGINSLVKGETRGLGAKAKTVKLKDVPFELPENATPQDRNKAIKEYLTSKGLAVTSGAYAKEFAKLNSLILSQKTA
jgi:hypothetical protein